MQAHDAHGFWVMPGWVVWNECPGWTGTEAASVELAERMIRCPRNAGIALECNPWVPRCLLQVFTPGYEEWVSATPSASAEGMVGQWLGIPVVRCVAMERGAWRLMPSSDAGRTVLAEGTIPVVLAGENVP
jgi:hypothetical protein